MLSSYEEPTPSHFDNLVGTRKTKIGLIIIESSANLGDNANAVGIGHALLNLGKGCNKSFEWGICAFIPVIKPSTKSGKLETSELKRLQEQLESPVFEQYVIIAPGSHGLKTLECIEKPLNSVFVSSAHQPYLELLEKIQDKLDIIVLPRSTIDPNDPLLVKLGKKLVKTKGVPHSTTKEQLVKEYSLIQSKMREFLNGGQAILIVMGGDAPDQQGVPHLYTPEEASKFAHYLY